MTSRADTLDDLARGIRRCVKCRLHKSRSHAVPGEGDNGARLFFVGEAPGSEEDRLGRPFVGRAGRFLDQMLVDAGLDRPKVFITSSVKCMPPGRRTPRADELEICKRNWLLPQLELVGPEIVILLGKTAVRQVLGRDEKLDRLHGRLFDCGGRRCFVTYHPAAGMRFPTAAEAIRNDFRKLLKSL